MWEKLGFILRNGINLRKLDKKLNLIFLIPQAIPTTILSKFEAQLKIKATISPKKEIADRYEKQYLKFKEIYPSVKELFKKEK